MSEAVAAARELAPAQRRVPARPVLQPREPARRTGARRVPRSRARLEGRSVDVLVAGVGTGGTITGAGEYLRERNPQLRIVAVEPRSSAVLSGGPPGPHRIQGIGAGFVPPVLNRELLDEVIAVSDDDAIQTRVALRAAHGPARWHLRRRRAVGRVAGRRPRGARGGGGSS